jgi:hypothetical protein
MNWIHIVIIIITRKGTKIGRKNTKRNNEENDGNRMYVISENPNEIPLLFYKDLKKTWKYFRFAIKCNIMLCW